MAEFAIARVGDRCTHGAVIITGSSASSVDGIPVARVGDLVSCPLYGHGINPIVTVQAIGTVDDRGRAHIQAKSKCGASIIAGSPDCSAGT